jgi:ClpP class serine protease
MIDDTQRQQIVDSLVEQARQPKTVTVDGMTVQYRDVSELLEFLRESSEPKAVVVKMNAPGALG